MRCWSSTHEIPREIELAQADVCYCHDRVALLHAKLYRWGLRPDARLRELERELQRVEQHLRVLRSRVRVSHPADCLRLPGVAPSACQRWLRSRREALPCVYGASRPRGRRLAAKRPSASIALALACRVSTLLCVLL
jgi:hypothetical protein